MTLCNPASWHVSDTGLIQTKCDRSGGMLVQTAPDITRQWGLPCQIQEIPWTTGINPLSTHVVISDLDSELIINHFSNKMYASNQLREKSEKKICNQKKKKKKIQNNTAFSIILASNVYYRNCPSSTFYIIQFTSGEQGRLANLHKWVRFSLGAQFMRPCATSKQKA